MKPEKKTVELNEDEKVVMNILKDNSPIDLNELKGQTALSNKKWDPRSPETVISSIDSLTVKVKFSNEFYKSFTVPNIKCIYYLSVNIRNCF